MSMLTVPLAISQINRVFKTKNLNVPAGMSTLDIAAIGVQLFRYVQVNSGIRLSRKLKQVLAESIIEPGYPIGIKPYLTSSEPALILYLNINSVRHFYRSLNGFSFEDLHLYSLESVVEKTMNLQKAGVLAPELVLLGEDCNNVYCYNIELNQIECSGLMNPSEVMQTFNTLAELLDHSYKYMMETSLRSHQDNS